MKVNGTLVINEHLGLAESVTPTQAQFESIISLDCSNREIVGISAISSLTNLQSLNMLSNQISDINPLSVLTSLKELLLHNNQITNINPLSNLINLQELTLAGNQISDINSLSSLTSLKVLALNSNQINNIIPLSNLTSLEVLQMDSNKISNISALSNLVNLKERLDLRDNQINDISALSGFTILKKLYLSDNQINDVSSLSGLTRLQELLLHNNEISDISSLSVLTSLPYLTLFNNCISDFSTLPSSINVVGKDDQRASCSEVPVLALGIPLRIDNNDYYSLCMNRPTSSASSTDHFGNYYKVSTVVSALSDFTVLGLSPDDISTQSDEGDDDYKLTPYSWNLSMIMSRPADYSGLFSQGKEFTESDYRNKFDTDHIQLVDELLGGISGIDNEISICIHSTGKDISNIDFGTLSYWHKDWDSSPTLQEFTKPTLVHYVNGIAVDWAPITP